MLRDKFWTIQLKLWLFPFFSSDVRCILKSRFQVCLHLGLLGFLDDVTLFIITNYLPIFFWNPPCLILMYPYNFLFAFIFNVSLLEKTYSWLLLFYTVWQFLPLNAVFGPFTFNVIFAAVAVSPPHCCLFPIGPTFLVLFSSFLTTSSYVLD